MSTDEAERLYSRLFRNLLRSDTDVGTFRRVAELGQQAAAATLSFENYQFALSVQADSAYDVYFKDRQAAVEFFGGPKAMGALTTTTQLTQFARAIDAASLIFIHAAVDAAISDLCRVTLLLGPGEWEQFVVAQKPSIAEVRRQGIEALIRERLQAHVAMLERESILKRADRLFAICKPVDDFDPVGNYSYDRTRLAAIDEERHRVTHGYGGSQSIEACAEKLDYLIKTGLYFAGMVNARFGVKINPLYALGVEPPVPAPSGVMGPLAENSGLG